jgi:cytochrome c-type biogenesis protein CcmF
MIGGALTLYSVRAHTLKSNAGFEGTSRVAFLLYNNILLVIASIVVFIGTLAPLVNDAIGLSSISVGQGWFTASFPWIAIALVALVAIGIHAYWKRGRLGESRNRIVIGLAVGIVLGAALFYGAYAQQSGKPLSLIGMIVGLWLIVSSLFDPVDRWRRKLSLGPAIVGMTLAHIGLGVGVIAISTVESYTIERDVALAPGETVAMGSYAYRFDKIEPVEGPNYDGVRAEVTVLRDGLPVTVLHPEKRNYWVQRSTMTEAGIEARWNLDLFVALGEDLGAGRWSIRAQIRPLIHYVWFAAFLMALGGALAASDKRYRDAKVTETATEPNQAPAT